MIAIFFFLTHTHTVNSFMFQMQISRFSFVYAAMFCILTNDFFPPQSTTHIVVQLLTVFIHF